MEFLHSDTDKRTVLAVFDGDPAGFPLYEFLIEEYNVIVADGNADCTEIIKEYSTEVSAILVDPDFAAADNYKLLDFITTTALLETTPIIIIAKRPLTQEDMEFFNRGVSDILNQPYFKELTINCIESAIRSKSAKTFYEIEKILSVLPSNIFLKDAKGRYMFSTKILSHLDTGGDPNWTIYGKTDLDVRKDKENAIKAMEADQRIIETGEGTNYIIEENTSGHQEFLELIKRPVFDDNGNVTGIIAIVNDVTEAELLRQKLNKTAHTDELTGLGNHRAFDEAMKELDSGGFYPVAVIAADCDGLKGINDTFGHIVGDEYIRMAAATFKANLPDEARLFRTGGDEFVAFLPHTTFEEVTEQINVMSRQNELFSIKGHPLSVSYGVAVVESSDDKVIEAVRRADNGMYDAKSARMKSRPEIYLTPPERDLRRRIV